MKKIGFAIALVAMLVVPSAAMAAPSADSKAASKECHLLKQKAGIKANFQSMGFKNMGDCVSKKTKEEAAERKEARRQARAECEAAGKTGNELAACIKAETKANKAAADAQDQQRINAAKACRTEQKDDPSTFTSEHGTRKNAFGKCVSAHARAKEEGEDPHADA